MSYIVHAFLTYIGKTVLLLIVLYIGFVVQDTHACVEFDSSPTTQISQEQIYIDGVYIGDVISGSTGFSGFAKIMYDISFFQQEVNNIATYIHKGYALVAQSTYSYEHILAGLSESLVYMRSYAGSFNMIGQLLILPRREDAFVFVI